MKTSIRFFSSQKRLYLLLIIAAFFIGLFCAHIRKLTLAEDLRFQHFTNNLFKKEVTSNTLTLHYTLADPKSYNIHNTSISLGTIDSSSSSNNNQKKKELRLLLKRLNTFHSKNLSLDHQVTYDSLNLILKTAYQSTSYPLLAEPLSPTLGIQAQLPILLAEYTFRTPKDVTDYLNLLTKIPSYFQEIISFEEKKAQYGYFMSKTTAERIIEQCNTFTNNPNQNYLISVFEDKIHSCIFLDPTQKKDAIQKNKHLILTAVIPSYQMLSQKLTELKDSGKNPYGLYYYPNGSDYYLCYLQASTGIYDSIETIVNRLKIQMQSDYIQIQKLLAAYPDLPTKCDDTQTAQIIDLSPKEMLSHLQNQMSSEFPAIQNVDYSIKYVHKDLETYLSPAFYLTPPIDTLSPNNIYINPHANQKGLSLYATLAHEGFPGHLYQTLYSGKTASNPIRNILSNSGFVEGWASYIESYAYEYAPVSREIGQYLARNRSFYLCLYSLLDIYIHYYGWNFAQTAEYLNALGIHDTDSQKEIYQILIEDPGNYLKYCLGSLYIQDLKSYAKKTAPDTFDCKKFHQALLTMGPVPFPVLKKYIIQYMSLQ